MQFGRKRIELPEDEVAELCRKYGAGEISLEGAGNVLGISYKTFQRRYNEYVAMNDMGGNGR